MFFLNDVSFAGCRMLLHVCFEMTTVQHIETNLHKCCRITFVILACLTVKLSKCSRYRNRSVPLLYNVSTHVQPTLEESQEQNATLHRMTSSRKPPETLTLPESSEPRTPNHLDTPRLERRARRQSLETPKPYLHLFLN